MSRNRLTATLQSYLTDLPSLVLVGESFSSAIRGRSSPGPARVRESLLEFVCSAEGVASGIGWGGGASSTRCSDCCTIVVVVFTTGRHTELELTFFKGWWWPARGDISAHLLSALRGCSLSGDSARLSSGDPGSELLGLTKPEGFLPVGAAGTVVEPPTPLVFPVVPLLVEPGEYDCVVFELPIISILF